MESDPGVRAAVLDHLEILASLALQAQYERDVQGVHVPAELVCGWFDDFDLPASAPRLFVGQDLASVRAFSDSFENALTDLADLTLSELHVHPVWLKVVEDARRLLQQLRSTR